MSFIGRVKDEIRIIKERDPAIHSNMEVFLYPSFKVMMHYRLAHKLYLKKHYFWARLISQRGVRKTGIEIHPGAQIGNGFFYKFVNALIGVVFSYAKAFQQSVLPLFQRLHILYRAHCSFCTLADGNAHLQQSAGAVTRGIEPWQPC